MGRINRSHFPALMLFLALGSPLNAAEWRELAVQPPPTPGTYCVVGTFSFNPGELESADEIRIFSLPGTNPVDATLRTVENWPGSGIMQATLAFTADSDDLARSRYGVEWGGFTNRLRSETAGGLPELRMDMMDPATGDGTTLSVGTLVVKVSRHPEIWYYWYMAPIGAIIAVLLYRKIRYFPQTKKTQPGAPGAADRS